MNNMYFDPSVKKYRNTENISILSSKVSTEIHSQSIDFDTFYIWSVFGFVIGENSFFDKQFFSILFSILLFDTFINDKYL